MSLYIVKVTVASVNGLGLVESHTKRVRYGLPRGLAQSSGKRESGSGSAQEIS